MRFNEISIDKNMKLVSLLNNAYIIAIKNLKVNISANYEYVTDPPYLADIG